MKVCPLCGATYQPFVDFCFADGEVLTVEAVAQPAAEPEGFDAPPPPKMLQGAQQGGGYTRSATPVPRARRPGRSIVQREGVYTPPADPSDVEPMIAASTAKRTPTPTPAPPRPDPVPEAQPEEVVAAFPEEDLAPPASIAEPPRPQRIHSEVVARTPAPVMPAKVEKPAASPRPAKQAAAPTPKDDPAGGWMRMAGLVFATFIFLGVLGALAIFVVSSYLSSTTDSGDPIVTRPVPAPQPELPRPPDPEPSQPDPADPEPVQPEPVQPEPVQPDPEPVQPEPVQPEPAVAVVVPAPVRPTPVPQPPRETRVGKVHFATEPAGAYIELDGTDVGTTPFMRVSVPYGKHKVRFKKPGYQDATRDFVVDGDELRIPSVTLISLAPEPAPVPVQPAPAPTEAPAPVQPAPVQPAPVATDSQPRRVMFLPPVGESAAAWSCKRDGAPFELSALQRLPVGRFTVMCSGADGAERPVDVVIPSGFDPGALHRAELQCTSTTCKWNFTVNP